MLLGLIRLKCLLVQKFQNTLQILLMVVYYTIWYYEKLFRLQPNSHIVQAGKAAVFRVVYIWSPLCWILVWPFYSTHSIEILFWKIFIRWVESSKIQYWPTIACSSLMVLFRVSKVWIIKNNTNLNSILANTRDLSRDDWIKEFIKRKWSSGLFWAVGAAEKKKSQLP